MKEIKRTGIEAARDPDLALKINESLKQQFTALELPQISQALSTIASDIKKTTVEFKSVSDALRREYSGATASAVEAIAQMKSAIASATQKVAADATELAEALERKHWGTTAIIAALALLLGFALGLVAGGRL